MTAIATVNPNFPPAPSTPEQQPDDDPFKLMTADNLQQMRDEQKRALTEAQKGIDFLDPAAKKAAEEAAKIRYEEIRQEYINSFDGMDENNPRYDEFMNILHQVSMATGTDAAGDRVGMPDSEWLNGEIDPATGDQVQPSGREMVNDFHDKLVEEYEAEQVEDEAENPTPVVPPMPAADNTETRELFTPQQLEEYGEKLDHAAEVRHEAYGKLLEARDKLADLTVKRQGRMGDKASAEYKEAHAQYHEAMIAYAKAGEAMLDAKKGAARPEAEKKATVVEYLLHEAAELRRITNEKWNNKTVNKICMWMARGNLAQRILKGVVVGGGAAAAAALVTAATAGTGTVGVLAGGGAAGALALSRGMRAYGAVRGSQMIEGHQDTSMTGTGLNERRTIDAEHMNEIRAMIDRYGATENGLEIGASHLHNKHERAILQEQKKNRKAVYFGIAATALGTGAAWGLSEIADRVGDYTDRAHGVFDRVIGDPDPNTSSVAPEAGTGTPDLPDEKGAPDNHGGSGEKTGSNLKELGDKYEAMATIDKGMGGEALFKELGLDPHDWYRHEDALLKAHPDDFYRMDSGHVGLAHTGRLSNETMFDLATRTGLLK